MRLMPGSMNRIDFKSAKDIQRLRRFALNAQGLSQAEPFGRGAPGAIKAISHLGYVQIDTISVVERAHHHVFRSRVPNFDPALTNKLLKNRSIFEYWSHAAAFLPMHDYRFSLPYKDAVKSGKRHWFRTKDHKLMQDLRKRIEKDGPLRSRDVEDARGNAAGWWDWKPAKRALEQLYMQGDLMITARDGFQKTYDLPERVLPADVDTSMPTKEEFAAHLLEQQLRCHGFVSLKGITYQRKDAELRQAIKRMVDHAIDQGDLEQIRLSNDETFVCTSGMLDQPTPRVSNKLRILSPFDNAVIQRARLKAIFDYDYQIECYVPEAKREFGYFCLPLLYRDQFVGRADCKAHRKKSELEVKALYFNEHTFGDQALISAFAGAIAEFTHFQGCTSLRISKVVPSRLKAAVETAINQLI